MAEVERREYLVGRLVEQTGVTRNRHCRIVPDLSWLGVWLFIAAAELCALKRIDVVPIIRAEF
jgi:hypothetical protein